MKTIVLVRHGETRYNREGRLQGWIDTTLTDRGREQARELGRSLADADRTVSSDLDRARETAAILASTADCPDPTLDADWRERNFGTYQGRTSEAVRASDPEVLDDGHVALDATPDGGESLEELRDRVLEGLRSVRRTLTDGETALVVTHGGPIRVVLGEATGTPLVEAFHRFSPPNCSRSTLTVEDSAPADALSLVSTDAE
jgi:probable phosphoglycerate mutase